MRPSALVFRLVLCLLSSLQHSFSPAAACLEAQAPAAETAVAPSGAFTLELKGQAHGGRQPVTSSDTCHRLRRRKHRPTAAPRSSSLRDCDLGLPTATSTSERPRLGNAITCPSTTSTTASEILYIVASAAASPPPASPINAIHHDRTPIGDCRTAREHAQPFIAINEALDHVAAMAQRCQHVLQARYRQRWRQHSCTTATNILGLTNASATATHPAQRS